LIPVSKHPIRIPAVRKGRRVRWTFEVSADVGADHGAREKTTPAKRQRARPGVKKARPSAASRHEAPAVPLLASAQPVDATPPVLLPELTQPVNATPAVLLPELAQRVDATPPVLLPELTQPVDATPAVEPTAVPMTMTPPEPVVTPVTPRAPQPRPAPARRTNHMRAIALAGAAALVIAALAFPRHPSAPDIDEDDPDLQAGPQLLAADLVGASLYQPALPAPIAAPVAASAAVAPRPVSAPPKTPAPKPDKQRVAASTTPVAPIAATAPVADLPVKENAAMKLPGSEAIAPPALLSASTGTSGTAPVTITGCLEISVDQDEFRLTETEGVDAPRSRSWRTGFLTKRSAPVALVEPPDRLALQTHVGRRVAATGLLTSHDLRVSALRVVGPACN
jgi:hypothetical protein